MSIIEPHTDQLHYIFNNAQVGIAICNAVDNRLELVNPAFARIHGYEPHELIGASPGEVFAPECMLRLTEHESTPSACSMGDVSFETTHIRKDGFPVPVSVHITVIKDQNGAVVQRIANVIDISKRKEAESELRMTHERFDQIYYNSPDVIYLIEVTPEGRFIHLDINPAFVEASGMAREQIVGRYVDEIEHEAFRSILLDKYNSCFKAGTKTDYINDYPLPSGIRTYHSLLTPRFDHSGRLYQIIGIARDITEQRYQEERLAIKEREFRSLAENTPDNIARWDTSGRYLYINPVHERTLGKSMSDVIGTTIPYTHKAVKNAVAQVAATGDALTVSQTVIATDGTTEYHEVIIVPERNEAGAIVSILGIGRNVTESKRAQLQLQQALEFNEEIIHTIPDLLFELDSEGTYLNIWAQDETLLAEQKNFLIGKKVYQVLSHDAVEVCINTILEVNATGKSLGNTMYVDLPEGRKWFELSASLRKSTGTYIMLSRDITERKKIEKQLLEQNRFLESLLNAIPVPIFLKDKETRYRGFNKAFEEFYGKNKEELLGKGVFDLFSREQAQVFYDADADLFRNGGTQVYEAQLRDARGVDHTVMFHKALYFDEFGEAMGQIGTILDITERKYQEERLQRTKAKLSAVISTIPDLIWVKDAKGVYMMCNPAFENFFGAECSEIIGKTDYDFISKEQADFFRQKDREAMDAGEMRINEEEIVFASNGRKALLETRKIPVYHDVEFMGVLGIGRDITEKKRLETLIVQNESRLKEAQKIAKVGSWELEFPGLELSWSDEIFRIFEIDPNLFQPTYDYFLNVIHPDDRSIVDMKYHQSLIDKTPYSIVHRLLMKDGRIKYVHELGKTLFDDDGNPVRSIGTVQDITEQKSIERKIEHMAHHDPLTGLPNRTLSKIRSEQVIATAKRNNSKSAVLFIDLDGFKEINDSLGHSTGDAMLKSVASRLKECIRESDILSRQGGDEFLIILSDVRDENDGAAVAGKILEVLEHPFEVNNHTLSASGSIGIALYPDHGETFETLLQNADTAMYKAKERGKNDYCFYTQRMAHNKIGQFKIQNDLKSGLDNAQFVLFYQPQIDLATKRIIGAEALIRWKHPQLGMIPPMNFIPVAENCGLIVQIGQWVIEESCRQAAYWHQSGIGITVAVNISAMQFKRGNLEEVVRNALLSSNIDPENLELELTESIIMHDTDNTLQTVRNLKSLGIQLSIDDFGTGYSSLSYLKRFAVDKLKIDQSFVRDILQDKEDAAIVKTIIQMAKNLNLKTIAEGVENQTVLSVIQDFGCDEVQGYHFAKPMEASEFEAYYMSFNSKG